MEKIMTNGFCELNEQEMMETDGGFQGFFDWICGATAAEKKAEQMCNDYYEYVKENAATVPISALKTADQYAKEYGWTRLA